MFIKQKSNFFLIPRGFTFIELLIVIAIIGILASIVLVSLNSARTKAKAAKLVSDSNQIAKALAGWGIEEGIIEWWHEDDFLPTCGTSGSSEDEPTITCLAENFALGDWLSGNAGIDTNLYVYDNDGDTFDTNGDGCADGSIWNGVFLNIWDQTLLDVVEEADDKVDNGDGSSCGKIIWDLGGTGGYFIGYRLGNNSNDLPF
ncbi:MAG: type II secretion system protein [Patescibacteria group bacterium]